MDRNATLMQNVLIDPFLSQDGGPWGAIFSLSKIDLAIDWWIGAIANHHNIPPHQKYAFFDEKAKHHQQETKNLSLDLAHFLEQDLEENKLVLDQNSAGYVARTIIEEVGTLLKTRFKKIQEFGLEFDNITMVGGPTNSSIWPDMISNKYLSKSFPVFFQHIQANRIPQNLCSGTYNTVGYQVAGWRICRSNRSCETCHWGRKKAEKMSKKAFDYTLVDAQAMPVTPVDPADFDLARYEEHAAQCDQRYARFLRQGEGVAVWQRVRSVPMFRGACRDMKQSLRWQLGGLTRSLDYLTDAATYLEPWYGVGVTASAFGAEYEWHGDEAPAVRPIYQSIQEAPELIPRDFDTVPIMQHTLEMTEYFLDQTQGRTPISWTDIQAPINVATSLIDTSAFLMAFYEDPDKVKRILAALTDVLIVFIQKQSDLIGDALTRPGHGFASSRLDTGIGLSEDNMVMISPQMYREFLVDVNDRIGAAFGGVVIHSCGNWAKWIEAVKQMPHLKMVDGAFSPQTDPKYNKCEQFRDAFVNTGVILHTRLVGDPDEVLARVKRLWTPGLKLVVVTYVQDPQAQRQLYKDIHRHCS